MRLSKTKKLQVRVSINEGTPKSSTLIGFSLINHPFWGTPIYGNPHVLWMMSLLDIAISGLFFPIEPIEPIPSWFGEHHPVFSYWEEGHSPIVS